MGAPIGNSNAKKENRILSDTLRRAITQSPDKLRNAIDKLLDKAEDGDLASFREIWDRLEGKPAQSLTIAGDEENPLEVVTKVEIIPLGSKDSSNT